MKVQTFCGFLLHCDTEGVALDVTSEQRTEDDRYTGRNCEQKEKSNRDRKDQQFPSQRHQVTSLQQLQDRF
jgi:hypothetical protein